jgi:hypothetical protein
MDAKLKAVVDWLHVAPSSRSIKITPRDGIDGGFELRIEDSNTVEVTVSAAIEEGDTWDDFANAFTLGLKLFGMSP